MFKSLLLILFVLSSLCFAQSETSQPIPVAEKIDEFGSSFDGEVKARMDNFQIELANNPSAQGWIINYGLPRDIKKRRAQLFKSVYFRKYDPQRLTIVDGGFYEKIVTEFWLVPQGAEPPTLQKEAKQIDEFEKATIGYIKARTDFLFVELNEDLSTHGYILNYGTQKQIALREKLIKREIAFRKYDLSRITFVDAGTGKTIKTEFWIDKKTP